METGTITSWSLEEGSSFVAGDVLCTIQTDKASVDFTAQDDGILAKILVPGSSDADLPVGTPICVVVEEEADIAAFADYTAVPLTPPVAAVATPPPPATTPSSNAFMMPSARFLVESKQLDASSVVGTGKGGRITKHDVVLALESGSMPAAAAVVMAAAAPATAAPVAAPVSAPAVAPVAATFDNYHDIPNNKMRKIIASRLSQSKREVPHFYTSIEVELDAVMKLRKTLASGEYGKIKVSVNDFVIRAVALALRDVRPVNYGGSEQTDDIHVSVAVATPTGLITPIVTHTDQRGLAQISDTVKDLAQRAREGKLAPSEYQGGTFSISNLGMFGITEFSAVINFPPQAAILAVGGGVPTIVPTTNGKPRIRSLMTARLSAHRGLIDEPTSALFLQTFSHYFTKPQLLLL
jgi:pyruvate dehydrogenase E2 component (dihydrolipoamide acetyltransferase)